MNNLESASENGASHISHLDNIVGSPTTSSLNKHKGTLCMRIGPMYSGKTTWLNSELTQFADKGFKVLKITHQCDKRNDVAACDESGSTHNSSYKSLSNKIKCVRVSQLCDVDITDCHVIGIDEAQFFDDLVTISTRWVEDEGKHLRVAGLDGDFRKHKFGQVLDLIPLCDEVVKLNASCKLCLEELKRLNFQGNIHSIIGPFTKRIGDSTEQILTGGSDLYLPVCRFHHSV